KVLGSARHPLNSQDFSAYVVQAQASKAKGLMFANGGNDIINGVKQAAEFGLVTQGMRISAPLAQFPDVRGLGLKIAQGLLMASPYYYDMNPEARVFTDRFAREIGRPPSFIQAGTYGAVLHYLKAVQAAGTDEAKAVMAEMRKLPINDFMTKDGSVRADGRVIRDMYLMQAKTPEESKGEWDLAKIIATVPGKEAFRPLNEGGCPLVEPVASNNRRHLTVCIDADSSTAFRSAHPQRVAPGGGSGDMKYSAAMALALLSTLACAALSNGAAARTQWDDALSCIAAAKDSEAYRAIKNKLPPTDGSAPSEVLLANATVPTDQEGQYLNSFHHQLGQCRQLVLQAASAQPSTVAAYAQLYADIDAAFARLVRREMTWGQYAQAGARSLAAFRTHSVEANRTLIPLVRS